MIAVCEVCKKEYNTRPVYIKNGRKCCGWKCRNINVRKRIKLNCRGCGKKIEIWPSYIKRSKEKGMKSYCSRECANKHKPDRPDMRGENNNFWKGGITPINNMIRTSKEYKLWRTAVFERDNYTCIWCGYRGKNLNADHIKPFASFPELRFAIDNGRTLCLPCHKTTDTYGNLEGINQYSSKTK